MLNTASRSGGARRLGHGSLALWLAVSAGLVAAVLPSIAGASRRVVLRDCGAFGTARPIVVRPRHIACGAVGAPDFTGLRWTHWGHRTARARGRVTYRDCPGVFAGCSNPSNYHEVPVRVRVSRIRTCDGHRAYTRLTATLREISGRSNRFHLDLAQSWSACW